MDAFKLLKQDHKKVSDLFSKIESASGKAKIQLFNQLKAELDLHAHIEETVLYPALENTDEAREITLEAYEEHKVVKDLLAELASAGTPDDEWDAKLTVLKENVEHHVEEEEGELFSKARRALGQERIEKLGAELEAEKASPQSGSAELHATVKTTKVSANKSKKNESPGVLQRLANLVGLGETQPAESVARPKPASKPRKAGAAKSAAKTPLKTKVKTKVKTKPAAPAKASTSRAKATKPSPKAAAKRKTAARATTGGKRQARSSRTSATKSAARAASNQRVASNQRAASKQKAGGGKTKGGSRKAGKSTKSRSKSR